MTLVLIVDDDVRSGRVLTRLLEDDGFEVELATDGASAIGRLSRGPVPDILVTDLSLPYVDGMAVAKYARSRKPGLPIFVITGYPEMVGRVRSLEPPAVVHTKPIDYATLAEELRARVAADP